MTALREIRKMEDSDIQEASNKLAKKMLEDREEQKRLQRVLEERRTRAEARAKLERMSDPEKAALLQELQAEGIESAEEHGTPSRSES